MSRKKRHKHIDEYQFSIEDTITEFKPIRDKAVLRPITEAQVHYMMAIEHNQLTFGLGPAGTGKTYVCSAMAIDALDNKAIKQVIITRPNVEVGRTLGSLPGDLDEKYLPFIEPFMQVCNERLGKSYTDCLIKNKRIKPMPLGYMRGATFKDAWVILDEAQNATMAEMKMFLTRIGDNCKVIVNGDPNQTDINGNSGLVDAVHRLQGVDDISIINFENEDIVRSGIVRAIIERYNT